MYRFLSECKCSWLCDKWSGVQTLGHMVIICFPFQELKDSSILDSYPQFTGYQFFPHVCQHLVWGFFFSSHSDTCETTCVTPHCGYKLHFVNNYRFWAFFPVFICLLYVFHGKVYLLLIFLTELCFSLTTGNKDFWYSILLTQYFSEWGSFYILMKSNISIVFVLWFMVWVSYLRILCLAPGHEDFLLCYLLKVI